MSLLLECSIRATLIAAAVAAVVGCLRIANVRARHTAWCGVLAAMLLLPAFSLWGPKLTVRALPAMVDVPAIEPWIPAAASPVAGPAGPRAPAAEAAPVQSPPWSLATGPGLWVAVYLACGVFLLVRLLLGTARAASLLKHAARKEGFLSSLECAGPITVGWRRPVVVLPASWTEWPPAELDAVLAHEREHVHRRDPLVQWVAALNRCIFWFHPLAWWLELRLNMLAEEACDAAAVECGHDPRDYSEYLIKQARAIRQAGARVALQGVSMGAGMGHGSLAKRIRRLLESRSAPALGRGRAAAGAALCGLAIAVFAACQVDRAEKAAAGQPTMNEMEHRRAEQAAQQMNKSVAIMERAKVLQPEEAQSLLAKLKQNPEDEDTYFTLLRHYEWKSNVKDLSAMRLWYIENHPGGKVLPGNINPQFDRAAYERGKSLWLAHLKQPGAAIEIYRRAADFLEGADRPLAEHVLEDGQKAYPNDTGWASAFGRHYAQALLGSGEPVTEYNVFRVASAQEAGSPYPQAVRARLAESTDARLLAMTAQSLLTWGYGKETGEDGMRLAQTYADRALAIDPASDLAKSIKRRLVQIEERRRLEQLRKMSPSELAAASDNGRMLLGLFQMEESSWRGNPDVAAAKARELLDLASKQPGDPLSGNAVFQANIVLGKAALRRGDKKAAAGNLMAAADAPISGRLLAGDFEMNLPRALVDWGERRTVAEFYEKMAPKIRRSKQFQDWAADIRKGINPDILPTASYPGCKQGPC